MHKVKPENIYGRENKSNLKSEDLIERINPEKYLTIIAGGGPITYLLGVESVVTSVIGVRCH